MSGHVASSADKDTRTGGVLRLIQRKASLIPNMFIPSVSTTQLSYLPGNLLSAKGCLNRPMRIWHLTLPKGLLDSSSASIITFQNRFCRSLASYFKTTS
ncbi:hypothetical protein CY34DRAFT_17229 [Suillus luteus UH-Slu-Lm8-n1]|uniref:Unplaced genomic scaffold CY34scaffold_528, whole genome shotgun sequence n=1 Tax=Suillus luteus UH-Slu-Lm8-n1 TaxID=930992 RepID=A0A0C9ZC59_9AGAM|nr:hypothetical protein CY34DRAFT_17229 [Suillus luteus UH-Slu-Lm8-n1]